MPARSPVGPAAPTATKDYWSIVMITRSRASGPFDVVVIVFADTVASQDRERPEVAGCRARRRGCGLEAVAAEARPVRRHAPLVPALAPSAAASSTVPPTIPHRSEEHTSEL